jgi:hypothetical protein
MTGVLQVLGVLFTIIGVFFSAYVIAIIIVPIFLFLLTKTIYGMAKVIAIIILSMPLPSQKFIKNVINKLCSFMDNPDKRTSNGEGDINIPNPIQNPLNLKIHGDYFRKLIYKRLPKPNIDMAESFQKTYDDSLNQNTLNITVHPFNESGENSPTVSHTSKANIEGNHCQPKENLTYK